MKIRLLLCSSLFCLAAFAQEKDTAHYIFTPLQIDATFPGGDAALHTYIQQHLVCPPAVTVNLINATCYVRFAVTETGLIDNVCILKGIPNCPECNQAAVKVISEMPRWQPQVYGRISGIESYADSFTIPIHFSFL
jgi:hypothetical protein